MRLRDLDISSLFAQGICFLHGTKSKVMPHKVVLLRLSRSPPGISNTQTRDARSAQALLDHLQCFVDHATSPRFAKSGTSEGLRVAKSVANHLGSHFLSTALSQVFSRRSMHDARPCHLRRSAVLTADNTACNVRLQPNREVRSIVSHEATSSAQNAHNQQKVRKT